MRRRFRIRTYLLLLVLVSAVPFIGFSALLLIRAGAVQTRGFARDVTAVARAVSLALDSSVALRRSALEALGRSPALAAGDLAAFHGEMEAAAALLGSQLSLSRADGQQVLNTARPAGAALPARTELGHVAAVARTGQAAVSNLMRGALNGELLTTLDVPVPGPDGSTWVLAVTLRLEAVGALLRSQRLPPDWVAAVVDRGGLFLARTLDEPAKLGTPASPDWTVPARTQAEGWVQSTTLEGVVTDTGFVRSAVTGWAVGIGVPAAVVQAPLVQALLPLGLFGGALTVLAAAAAVAVARRIARPVTALARLGAAPEDLELVEAQQVAAALQAAEVDRRAAEAALRESEAELRAARELSPQAPWTADASGHLLSVSGRVGEVTGASEAARQGEGWLSVVHPDDAPRAAAAWAGAVTTGTAYDSTFRVRDRRRAARDGGPSGSGAGGGDGAAAPDPGWCWMRARAAPRLGADGRPVRWYGTTEDVDDAVRAQQALHVSESRLRAMAAGLEARVEAEVAAREAAQAALHQSQRMEALGKLAAGVAHDFNNVLQAVGGSLSLILRAPGDAKRVERVAAAARDAVTRGAGITGRMLSMARRPELQAGPVDAGQLLRDLQAVLQHTLGGGVAVVADVPSGLPPLLADRGQLETVLINLATNARDAMPRGGTLRFSARQEGRMILLAASDTGQGMAPDVLARAREPFFTTKPPGAGTGLGLAMAHGFAEGSGGELRIASAPGAGTDVTLALPAALPAECRAGAAPS